jgi:hypothetical protein
LSAQFSDTTNYKGLVQLYEKEVGFERGRVSSNADLLKEFTAAVNQAFDDFVAIAIQAGGTWQFDDSNFPDYPIITTNLVAGQRDYSFTTDQAGNLILDIYDVFIKNEQGVYCKVYPMDVQSDPYSSNFTNGLNIQGVPCRYDKTANGFFLDPVPQYASTAGLKVYINREASYFSSTDTTKKPGVPGLFHKYFYLKPALDYARRNNLANYQAIANEVSQLEGVGSQPGAIAEYFANRAKDERQRLGARRYIHKFI